jgi:hypothetical protein
MTVVLTWTRRPAAVAARIASRVAAKWPEMPRILSWVIGWAPSRLIETALTPAARILW